MHPERQSKIRELFDDYIEMYAARDDRLTARFSQSFTGYSGSGSRLIRDREEWVRITRQDFAQVPGRIRIEMLDLALQDPATTSLSQPPFPHPPAQWRASTCQGGGAAGADLPSGRCRVADRALQLFHPVPKRAGW